MKNSTFSLFRGLPADVQEALTELSDRMYEPDDGTPLQELAAKAWIKGFLAGAANATSTE